MGIREKLFFLFVICGFANSRDRPKNRNKNVPEVTPDLRAPEEWHEAGSVLRPQQYQVAPQFKSLSLWRTGSQDVWTPTLRNFSLLIYLIFGGVISVLLHSSFVLRHPRITFIIYSQIPLRITIFMDWHRQTNTQNFSMGGMGEKGLILRPRIIHVWF